MKVLAMNVEFDYPQNLKPISVDNINQLREIGGFNFPEGIIRGLRYSPDSKYLAVLHDNEVILWDVQAAVKHRSFPHFAYIETVAFSADGKILLTNSKSMLDSEATGSELHCWDVETGAERSRWKPSVGFAGAAAFNPQNPAIRALTSFERTLQTRTSEPNKKIIHRVDSFNVGIELWDGENLVRRVSDFIDRERMHHLNGRLLAFSRDGKTLYGCAGPISQKQVFAWEYSGSGDVRLVTEPGECSHGLELDPHEEYLTVSDVLAGQLTVRHLKSNAVVYRDKDPYFQPYYFSFDGQGQLLVVGRMVGGQSSRKIVDIVSLNYGKLVRRLNLKAYCPYVAFSPDNRTIAVQMSQDEILGMEGIVLWGVPE
jgi:WD40 repeat protein